jgi:anaerobic magnesium-protoporphyrin IX monomethyl ester cyclase
VMVLSSRGCHGNCSFCSVAPFYRLQKGPSCRYRSAANFVDELEEIGSVHNVVSFLFEDDNFIGPAPESKEHARSIAEEISRRGLNILFGCGWRVDSLDSRDPQDRALLGLLKKAGLFSVFLGLESGHDEGLALYNKRVTLDSVRQMVGLLAEEDISPTVGFIMFNSYSTVASLSRNAEFLRETSLGTEFRHFSQRVQLQPGVSLIRKLDRDGLLREPRDISDVHYYEFKDASVRRIADAARYLYKRVAFTDGEIRSTILDSFFVIRKFKDLWRKVNDPLLGQNADALFSKLRSIIKDLNATNYETFMGLVRAATVSADAKALPDEFHFIEETHLKAIGVGLESLKNFCEFLRSSMDVWLGRFLGPANRDS